MTTTSRERERAGTVSPARIAHETVQHSFQFVGDINVPSCAPRGLPNANRSGVLCQSRAIDDIALVFSHYKIN